MPAYRPLSDADVHGKRVLVRVDLNLPMRDGKISDATRVERVLPTIRELQHGKAKVILLSHFGRPKGKVVPEMSLRPIADALALELGEPVFFVDDCVGHKAREAIDALAPGKVLLLENTRFHASEEANDKDFARELAAEADVFVSDAFSAAHRAHASTEGVTHHLPTYAGRAMQAELDALEAALGAPKKPVVAVVGGAKVSTKLDLLSNLVTKVDTLIIGGGMANTFLAAQGKPVGKSLCEHDLAGTANKILFHADSAGCEIVLPTDVVVAGEFKAGAASKVVSVDEVGADDMILDVGPASIEVVATKFAGAKTVIWNGPFGAFEIAPFDKGTVAAARKAAELVQAGKLIAVAGGGDTVAALKAAGVADQFTYVSTAGGAFLEWMEGKELPGVAALAARADA